MFRLLQSLLFLLVVFSLCSCKGDDISIVKNGYMNFDQSVTIGDVLDNCKGLENRSWSKFETELKRKVVNFTADIPVKIDLLTPNHPLTTNGIAVLKDIVMGTDPVFQLTLQFQLKQNDSFELTYAGITLKPNLIIEDISVPDAYKSFVDTGQTYSDPTYMLKQLYQNQELVPYNLLHAIQSSYFDKKKEAKRKKRKIIANAFNTFEFPSDYGRARFVMYLNEKNEGILFGNVQKGILGGAYANNENGSTCSFFEKGEINSAGTKFEFNNPSCTPEVNLKDKTKAGMPRIIAVSGTIDCSFCEGGSSLDGEYHAVGYLDVYEGRGPSLTLW